MKYKLPRHFLLALALFTVYCLVALAIRNRVQENTMYNFLKWNLFLAFVPFAVAFLIYIFYDKLGKLIVILGSCAWLLFYPNAPYMISDLIHVQSTDALVIYDTLIIFSFSILALFFGFYSLKIIHLIFRQMVGIKTANTIVFLSIIIASGGIYLGRILRLNSWDLFTHPIKVFTDVFHHLFPVTKNPATYAILLLFSIIQFLILMMMKEMNGVNGKGLISSQQAEQ